MVPFLLSWTFHRLVHKILSRHEVSGTVSLVDKPMFSIPAPMQSVLVDISHGSDDSRIHWLQSYEYRGGKRGE